MSKLEEILGDKRSEVERLKRRIGKMRPTDWPVRSAYNALVRQKRSRLRLITEIKFNSPSAGKLSVILSAKDRARVYERSGATMVSVLTDPRFFHGSFDYLYDVRDTIKLPVLCKDFIIDRSQIHRAWEAGADAVLLIARCLPDSELKRLMDVTMNLGLDPVVEVTTEQELEAALQADAKIIGVNARDLATLQIDTDRSTRVLAAIPDTVVAIHFSGLKTPEDVARVAATNSDAALIGESLMREDDPTGLLKSMVTVS